MGLVYGEDSSWPFFPIPVIPNFISPSYIPWWVMPLMILPITTYSREIRFSSLLEVFISNHIQEAIQSLVQLNVRCYMICLPNLKIWYQCFYNVSKADHMVFGIIFIVFFMLFCKWPSQDDDPSTSPNLTDGFYFSFIKLFQTFQYLERKKFRILRKQFWIFGGNTEETQIYFWEDLSVDFQNISDMD